MTDAEVGYLPTAGFLALSAATRRRGATLVSEVLREARHRPERLPTALAAARWIAASGGGRGRRPMLPGPGARHRMGPPPP
ncbi:hypothetical protein [Streptomyces dysideae]|uniref:hypothetical protein n=1 Tax=Streptomyces dysideae TaxID=909626 RepID=UPI001F1F8B6B|nr:hypothetical protein [Streptomyces dysideae]